MSITAMKQALKAIEDFERAIDLKRLYRYEDVKPMDIVAEEAMHELRAAIAEAEAQPLEFRQFLSDALTAAGLVEHGKQSKALAERLATGAVRYMAGAHLAPKQEPVGRIASNGYPELYKPHSLPAWTLLYLAAGTQPVQQVQEDKRAQLFGMQPPAYCAADIQEQRKQCWCTTCRPITMSDMRFVVCPDCGNKRCPKAHNHTNACTDSNEPGQVGSSWEHVAPQQAQEQRKPLTRSEKNRIWSSCSDATTLSARASLFGTKVEQHHGIKEQP